MSDDARERLRKARAATGAVASAVDAAATSTATASPVSSTPTTTTATAPNDVPEPDQSQQDQAQTDPSQPQVDYYLYQLDPNGQPVGMFRVVFTTDNGMRIDKLDGQGKWSEDDTLIGDLGGGDDTNDNADPEFANTATEEQAKQVYDQHFSKEAQARQQNATTPPTSTEQSPPASGTTSPPTKITPGPAATPPAPAKGVVGTLLDHRGVLDSKQVEALEKIAPEFENAVEVPNEIELPDDHPFFEGLDHKVTFVPSLHPRYDPGTPGGLGGQFRPKVRIGDLSIVDDISVPHEPPIRPDVLEKIKLLGIDKPANEIPKGEKSRELLGDFSGTDQLYQVDGKYPPWRAALHERLLDRIFAGHEPKPEGERTATFAAGGTASGKSSTFKADPSLMPPDAVEVNPDDFKLLLPEWDYMTKDDPPDPYAAAALHEESGYIAMLATERALAGGYNVFVDGTGDSGSGRFMGKLTQAHDSGHKVEVLMVDAGTNEAINRNVDRGTRERRYVPITELKKAHRGSINRIQDWYKSPVVSRWSIWRTNERPPTLVASGGGGTVSIHNQREWESILAKPNEEGKAGNPG